MNAATGPLLVLGAGEEQVAIYREARRRGLPTIGVDMRADRPGIPLADEFLQISTIDHAGIAHALTGRRIGGVVSTAADTCLESWHQLARHFRTPWQYPAAAVRVSMDKSEFHKVAASIGMPTYRWIQSDNLAVVAETARGFRFPLVVKPTDASGGRGIHRADTHTELDSAIAYAARHSPRGQVIVEECLVGRHLTVNVFMSNGSAALSLITEQDIVAGAGFLIGGHVAPAELDPTTELALLADASRVCAAFDLTDGPANFDVILAADGTPYFIEVGARMSGNGYSQLVTAVNGVDWLAALVDLATGRPVTPVPTHQRPARLRVLTSPLDTAGELVAVNGLADVLAIPGVEAVELFYRPGDSVLPFTEAGRKLGWIVVTADRPDQLGDVLLRALRELRIDVRPLITPSTPVGSGV